MSSWPVFKNPASRWTAPAPLRRDLGRPGGACECVVVGDEMALPRGNGAALRFPAAPAGDDLPPDFVRSKTCARLRWVAGGEPSRCCAYGFRPCTNECPRGNLCRRRQHVSGCVSGALGAPSRLGVDGGRSTSFDIGRAVKPRRVVVSCRDLRRVRRIIDEFSAGSGDADASERPVRASRSSGYTPSATTVEPRAR